MQTHQCSDSMQTRGCSTPCKLIDAPTPSPNIIRCRGCLFQWHGCSGDMLFVPVTWLFLWHVVCSSDMFLLMTFVFPWHVCSSVMFAPLSCLFRCHVCFGGMFVPVTCLFQEHVCPGDICVPVSCLFQVGFFFKLHHNHNLYCSQANVQCPPSSSNNCLSATVFFIALVAQFILTIGYFVYR